MTKSPQMNGIFQFKKSREVYGKGREREIVLGRTAAQKKCLEKKYLLGLWDFRRVKARETFGHRPVIDRWPFWETNRSR
jgi:hypothetical protein